MTNAMRPRSVRAPASLGGWAVVLGALTGCQSYAPSPLNYADHRAALDARLDSTESVSRFIDRLSDTGAQTPDRFDPTDGLSLAEGEVLALFFNPDLRLARLDAGVALATYETAGLWEDPEFGFDGAEILSPADPFEFGLTLSLTVPVSGRLDVEKDRAGAAYETELSRVVDAEWSMRARVRSAWAAWSASVERLRMLRAVIVRIEQIAELTDRLESAGELTRVEARLLRAELVERRSEVSQAKLEETQARVELLGLMGLTPDARVELLPSLPSASHPVIADPTARLIEANTALAVRRAEYQVAEETLRLAIREQYPDITLGGGFGSEDDDRLLLGVSVPVPILNANRAGIAVAKAEREVARALAETTFEKLTHELALASAAFDAVFAQRQAYERELVPMLAEQSSEVERLVELGEFETLILLETVTRRYEAMDRLLDLRLAELDASIEIARLLGPDWPAEPAPIPDLTNTTGGESTTGHVPAEEVSR